MRALVIDDSRATRKLINKLLSALDYEVLEAGDGKEALGVLDQSGPVDVVLLDWNMPVMNGYEFLTELRTKTTFDDMPVMMVTTEAEMSQVAKALQAGANEYVMKPFTRDIIAEKLEILGVRS